MVVLKLVLIVITSLILISCQAAGYYLHVSKGQLELLSQRQNIEELLADESIDPELKQQLESVRTIRQFASERLGLPENASYSSYADLNREYVVWNVFAAEAFSVEPKQWCFLVAGCVAYRGYFDEQEALAFASELSEQGYDTYVGGVAAYSTLGWFDDPVLNTFITRDEPRLAGLMFHELAHQQLYINDDTTFNESFASAVEVEGVRRWLAQKDRPDILQRYLLDKQRQDDFIATLLEHRKQLEQFYQQALPEQARQSSKQKIQQAFLAGAYQQFKQRWDDYPGYDDWVMNQLNNAKLSTIVSYNQWLPAFQQLLQDNEGDLTLFYQAVEQLGSENKSVRQEALTALNLRSKKRSKKN
jgi:predicted aminopeptidase